MVDKIKTICIIGAGFMGKQIMKRSALYNYNIRVFDINLKIVDIYIKKLIKELREDGISAEITLHTKLSEAVQNADLIIEAVPEKLELKKDIFSSIDKLAPPHAIIATNSSSFPVSKIEDVIERKDKVMNIHFYSLSKYPMADIMKGTQTSDDTFERGKKWVESIDITPLVVKKESFGFVFNRIWRAIKKECLKIWAEGYADIETIDQAWKIFTGMEIGPFNLMDNVGLDVIYDIEMSYYHQSGDNNDIPPILLKKMVDKGHLGRKSGKGFYAY
ncbi:MAG: 3-hydroxyacyl-CoA dehydrogenase family protein [Candidatus Odinarchaeota archaeon]